jgi:hypothetical protein
VTVGTETLHLTRDVARVLRDAVAQALAERREFVRTVGILREDGSYVVRRRGAESSGNARVFEDIGELQELYGRLPTHIDAKTVGRTGVTGSRRHMLVWHLVEHPSFPCELVSRNPLEARKL